LFDREENDAYCQTFAGADLPETAVPVTGEMRQMGSRADAAQATAGQGLSPQYL